MQKMQNGVDQQFTNMGNEFEKIPKVIVQDTEDKSPDTPKQ
jgi:hypothetical protein